MGKPMNIADIPQTDSIQELARFWDTHDLTGFEDLLEEVSEPVFERRRTGNPTSLKIISGARREEPTELANQWEIEIGFYPPQNNDSVFSLLKKIESKGVRLALRNPHPPDAITIAILVGSGASLIKSVCGLINTWVKGQSDRKVSITGEGFKIETTGFSPSVIAGLTELATAATKKKLPLKPKGRKAKSTKTSKKKVVGARK